MSSADEGRAATANVLGALALAVVDQLPLTVSSSSGRSDSAAAALSAIEQFLGEPSLEALGRVLGLTHSGAVRLIDRLAEAGLLTRGPGVDGRSRAVRLTPAGRRAAGRVRRQRAGYLESLLTGLSPAEAGTLRDLLGRVMAEVVRQKEGGAWICRLCDLRACGRPAGYCPAANAAAARGGR